MSLSNAGMQGAKPGVCTSTTRPTNPYLGQIIYETDTGYLRVWDGANWDYLSAANGFAQGLMAGRVLNVASTTKTDTFTTTSTSYADVTGLSVAITPQTTSSKILVISSLSGTGATGLTNLYVQLVRGSTAIAIGDAANLRRRATGTARDAAMTQQVSMLHLDSPSTTSSTTYKVQVAAQSANLVYVNRSVSDGDDITSPRTVSTITVLEVAG